MADLAFPFQLQRRFIGTAGFEMIIIRQSLRVHEVKVKILDAAGVQLALEERTDIRLGLEEIRRQLVRQDIAVTGIALRETFAQRKLALALQIAVRGVEVVEARAQEGVDHFRRLRDVDLFALHRQAHEAEAKLLFDVLHANAPSCLTCPCGHGLY